MAFMAFIWISNYAVLCIILQFFKLFWNSFISYPDWRAAVTEPKRFSKTSMVKELHWTSSVAVKVNGDTAPSFAPYKREK